MTNWFARLYYREIKAGPAFISILMALLLAVAIAEGLIYKGIIQTEYDVDLPGFFASIPGREGDFQYGAYSALGNARYFEDAKQALIVNKTKFIEANLTTMLLNVYENGQSVLEVPILTKGKPGSWWETPAGIYKVEAKRENHFSSFGHVYQPWSMVFQGNFFIHGWPYYDDGSPVAPGYSGGCIRLSTDDAKKVYDIIHMGTPVLVYEKSFSSDGTSYAFRPPTIDADTYLVADLSNNFVFSEKDKNRVLPIASVTKLVTALAAAEYINLDKTITITDDMLATTSIPRFKVGDSYTAYELLYPLLQESSNEAGVALSKLMPGNAFINIMNKKALAIGMKHTRFTDPFGGDAGNVSSAEDLFQLAKFLNTNRSFVLRLSAGTLKNSAYDAPDFPNLRNFNIFAGDTNFIGGKVGKTNAAKETMLALFKLEYNGIEHPIAIIVLGSLNIEKDVRTLYEYAESNFSMVVAPDISSKTTDPVTL